MRYIFLVLVASVADAIHSVSVVSLNAYDCNAVSGVDVAFASDEKSITASFPLISLTVAPPAHGYPGGNSSVGCGATVEFEDWPTGVRFAISNVTWHTGALNLTKSNLLHSLRAKVDLVVEHETNTYPLHYPIVKNYASATLLDLDIDPALNDFQGKYELSAKNPRPYWSTCFNGYLANATKITFQLGGSSSGGGTSQPGWSMDLGLVWESCYAPNETVWGQKVIRGWESCTYRETNATAKRSKALYPML
ncbi:hypothetical protein EKO27_g3776 [Xylaria grammica]|uniref:Uncharacterized protein n=1 Tax=Xylaria grammica TaxID=363999 RepID=A0A439DA93_9PEZI|nr:hypothetical protein EKO27_g3776 [Xylaria grammica]